MDRAVRLWDPVSRSPLGPPLTRHAGSFRTAAFSPDGRFLAAGGDGEPVGLRATADFAETRGGGG